MEDILNTINSPRDLKELSLPEMTQLAGEIRQFLVKTVAERGGHLASNLGVVELSLALHAVFDSPRDKIIWDVGHQAYVHKLLTGRRRQMGNLRQYGGISGFPKREESEHDAFNTGHSSTSISAALGVALARDLQGEDHSVVAVIGDGALTAGMAFEALNHAGQEDSDLIVILNDNEMSISKNVGAMSAYLNRLRSDPSYSRTKEEIESVLKRIPGIGPNLARAAGKFKDTVKYLMVPGIIFEELGFTYIGPVNGHDLAELKAVLNNIKKMKGPILLHTITQKGKGYAPAFQKPDIFHGVGPFDVDTGTPLKKSLKTYTEIFGEYMLKRGSWDNKLVAITAAMTSGTGLSGFSQQFPGRFFDVGICEQHAVTLAAGMASAGLRPVVAVYSTFLQRAYDQIIHDVALQKLPVIFALDRAGLVGEDGPTHHGAFDLSYLRLIPNLIIMAPADENELMDMLHSAFSMPGPVAIRYPRGVGEGVKIKPDRQLLEPGQSRLIKEGQDLAIVAIGRGVSIARDLADILASKGINPLLIDARFAKPIDRQAIIGAAHRCRRLLTIEDNSLAGGFGSAIGEILVEERSDAELLPVALPDEFVEHGKVDLLFEQHNMDPDSILERILRKWPEFSPGVRWELLKFGQS